MTRILETLLFATPTFWASEYDYAYIGPGKNDVPWFDLFALGLCVVGLVVVVRGAVRGRKH